MIGPDDPQPEDLDDPDLSIAPFERLRSPPSLLKATQDYFDYALKLTTGEVIRFAQAKIHGDYVTLEPLFGEPFKFHRDYHCPRGVDVRLDQIVWCADAPEGS